jgi:hypothetical protein
MPVGQATKFDLVLIARLQNPSEGQTRLAVQGLQQLGSSDGRNAPIDAC